MYGKIFASLYQGTLRGKPDEILVFTNMIACCDRYGEVDKHPKAISDETGLPIERVLAAILVLESPDAESRSREQEGSRITRCSTDRTWGWVIVNYVKYRSIRDEETRREQNLIAVRKHRSKSSSPVSQCNPDVINVIPVSHSKPMHKQMQMQKGQGLEGPVAAAPVFSEVESIIAIDKATAAKVAAEPMKISWLDWRSHHRVGVSRAGEDGDTDAWKALWNHYGQECMDAMYDRLIPGIQAGKKIWYSQAAEWLTANTEIKE